MYLATSSTLVRRPSRAWDLWKLNVSGVSESKRNGVEIGPGATLFTLILLSISSFAAALLK